jgi:outer membrane protein OmpA-like peptidoglycan-associated protein
VPCWVSYREFWFSANSADILSTQQPMFADMADYVKRNPSLFVAIDGHMDARNRDLSNRRINAVRDGLVNAGLPADRIKVGDYGDSKLRRDGRVEVLIKTGP